MKCGLRMRLVLPGLTKGVPEEVDGRCRRLTGLTLIFGLEATNMPCRMALGKGVLCSGASISSGAVIGPVPILVLSGFTRSEAFGRYGGARRERMGPTNQWMVGSFTRDICRETFIFGLPGFTGGRARQSPEVKLRQMRYCWDTRTDYAAPPGVRLLFGVWFYYFAPRALEMGRTSSE